MPTLHRTITTATDPGRAYTYLRDFTHAVEWDSGTESCVLVSGSGGPGTVYRNVSRFMGRRVTLDYTVLADAEPTFVIEGIAGRTTSRDIITVTPKGTGSLVDYQAEFTFAGPARLLTPLLRLFLERLGTRTAAMLTTALARQ